MTAGASIDLVPYQTLIKERCGLLFTADDTEKLQSALTERSAALGIPHAAYYPRLLVDETEFQALVNRLTINETYFFREPEQIRLLVERLAPRRLAAQDGSSPVRILSAGCSSGEEPYSLVMALHEKYGSSVSRLFSFVAGDIDSEVLAKARGAHYTEFSFRGVPAALRQRYFEPEGRMFRLKDEIRQQVGFHELNLLSDAIPAVFHDCDIIFFRNVSIYFDTPTRRKIQENLVRLLKTDGMLVIGTAETLANDLGVLPLIEENGLFYFSKGEASSSSTTLHVSRRHDDPVIPVGSPPVSVTSAFSQAPPLPLVTPSDWGLPATAEPASFIDDLAAARSAVHEKRYADALSGLDAVLDATPEHTEARLLKAHVLLERKDFSGAETLARSVLAADEWNLDALLLLGLAAKWRDDGSEASRHFKQAVYAHPACWPAHYFLADVLRDTGADEPARRAYRTVMQLLAEGVPETGIRVLPLELPAGQMRFLCERQLARLDAGARQPPLR